jgi:hypothetical protein
MVTKRTALANVYVWGVAGCALGVLGVTYIARGPVYALPLTQAGATFLIASPDDSTKLIELRPISRNPNPHLESVVRQSSGTNQEFPGKRLAFNSAWISGE